MAPMEEVSRKCPSCSQGGGVFFTGGTATFTGCYIYDNQAYEYYVRLSPPSHSMAPLEGVTKN